MIVREQTEALGYKALWIVHPQAGAEVLQLQLCELLTIHYNSESVGTIKFNQMVKNVNKRCPAQHQA